uniref:Endonuclease/exonuclease/phosphatase domain-containing protein n=1 Tax=Anopheles atroparvus TaxID=41427 RepID=A0A182JG29_ANOAO
MVLGDFNTPALTWLPAPSAKYLIPARGSASASSSSLLIDGLEFNGLLQISGVTNLYDRQLDLVFVNSGALAELSTVRAAAVTIVAEDNYHPALELIVALPSRSTARIATVPVGRPGGLNFSKCNYAMLDQLLSATDWSVINTANSVNDAASVFTPI